MKFVIAGTQYQYKDWLSKNGHNPQDYCYVHDVRVFHGTEDPHGLFIGTWYERPDIGMIIDMVRVRQKNFDREKFFEGIKKTVMAKNRHYATDVVGNIRQIGRQYEVFDGTQWRSI